MFVDSVVFFCLLTENIDRLVCFMARFRISTASIIMLAHRLKRIIIFALFLPQSKASDITGGIYIKTPEPAGLLQFLIVSPKSQFVLVDPHNFSSVTCVLL